MCFLSNFFDIFLQKHSHRGFYLITLLSLRGVTYQYRLRIGFHFHSIGVHQLLKHCEALCPNTAYSCYHLDILIHKRRAVVIIERLDGYKPLIGLNPVRIHAERGAEKIALADIKVMLVYAIVDVPERIDIAPPDLNFCFDHNPCVAKKKEGLFRK